MHRWERPPSPIQPRGKRVAWSTPLERCPPLVQLQAEQKTGGQHHGDRLAVEAWPPPALVLVPIWKLVCSGIDVINLFCMRTTCCKRLTFPLCCVDQISCWLPRNTRLCTKSRSL